jgi:hypothetical protein
MRNRNIITSAAAMAALFFSSWAQLEFILYSRIKLGVGSYLVSLNNGKTQTVKKMVDYLK